MKVDLWRVLITILITMSSIYFITELKPNMFNTIVLCIMIVTINVLILIPFLKGQLEEKAGGGE